MLSLKFCTYLEPVTVWIGTQSADDTKNSSKTALPPGPFGGADTGRVLRGISSFLPRSPLSSLTSYTGGKWGSERLSHLPSITLQVGRAGI